MPNSLVDWVRRPHKSHRGGSIFWKAIIKSFHLIEDPLAWKVGDRSSVRIGLDPWPSSGQQHILPQEIRESLADRGLLHLHQVADLGHTTIWRQAWQTGYELGLQIHHIPLWEPYLGALSAAHIHLQDRQDELCWMGDPSGIYTPKAGYINLCIDILEREEKWWWWKVWKLRCPTKARLLIWTNIENKTPT